MTNLRPKDNEEGVQVSIITESIPSPALKTHMSLRLFSRLPNSKQNIGKLKVPKLKSFDC